MDVYYFKDGRHTQSDSKNGSFIYFDGSKYCTYRNYAHMMRDVLKGGHRYENYN